MNELAQNIAIQSTYFGTDSITRKSSFLLPKVKMGLLVDLTNTSRFYDRNDIEKEGIKYIKLQCKG